MIPVEGLIQTNKGAAPPSWVITASRQPVAFAQVREDSALDQWVVDQLPGDVEVLMVASGGCTAASLASMPKVRRLHLIDPNPAQIALSRLKLRLLATAGTTERLSILGHAPMPLVARQIRLTTEFHALNLPDDVLGSADFIASVGPDYAGRYEILFSKLREALRDVEGELKLLLQLRDPVEQSWRAAPGSRLGDTLDLAFDSVMALPNLVGLFGEAATRNRCEPFSRHFAGRTRHILATLPAADNPWLWQMLQGCFPKGTVHPWLSAAAVGRIPEVVWTNTTMADALSGFREEFDFIHLSNILDWLAPDEARATLDLAWRALRPGGWTLIRQLNSNLDVQEFGKRFEWKDRPASELHDLDRSFFYRKLYLGQK